MAFLRNLLLRFFSCSNIARKSHFIHAILSACFLTSCTQETATQAISPPNFVILFADDMGYADLGCYGNPVIRTPNLDKMAQEGMRLTSFYVASPTCSPSRASLLTGRYPNRCGVPRVLGPNSPSGLPASETTLAEALKDNGYKTAVFGKWHLGAAHEGHFPPAHGFDEFFGLPYSNDMIPPWVETERPLRYYDGNTPLPDTVDQTQLTRLFTEKAVAFIKNSSATPFFLYLPYSMPHVPLAAHPDRQGKSLGGLYGDVIEEIDWSAGQILQALEEAGVAGNTLVLFSSDNGPWSNMPARMFAGGQIDPWHAGSAGPFRGAKATVYEGGYRVPGIFRWPGKIQAGTVHHWAVTALDVFPTFLSLAGIGQPAGPQPDGDDASAVLLANTPMPERPFFYMLPALKAVRKGPWKLILKDGPGPGAPPTGPAVELYHLDHDLAESHDRAGGMPDKVAELMAELAQMQTSLDGSSQP